MKILEYTVNFATPAFLGNAEQQAQWRTPPFKALIRQWWRVVKANDLLRADVPAQTLHFELLRLENELFGAASDAMQGGSHQSLVRLRCSCWDEGKLRQWPSNEPKTIHPEVKFPVGTDLYLGYGPLNYDKVSKNPKLSEIKGTDLRRTAIDDKAAARIHLMFPAQFHDEICQAVQLASWFGTLGSRSRNGWGSLHFEGAGIEPLGSASLAPYLRPLGSCLELDWPHAVGKRPDNRPAVWKTESSSTWRDVMKHLARIKISFRTQFKFYGGGPHGDYQDRLILAYPITKHAHTKFGNDARLANQIRFKVTKEPNGMLSGLIAHLPCKLPDTLLRKLGTKDQQFVRNNELAIWQQVQQKLDELCSPL